MSRAAPDAAETSQDGPGATKGGEPQGFSCAATVAGQQARDVLAQAMDEATLLRAIIDCALTLGYLAYHVTDSRKDSAGFPDLVLVPPGWTERPDTLPALRAQGAMFAELKTERGRLRLEQRTWLGRLERAGSRVFVWRPADWRSGRIEAILRGEDIG